MNRALLGKHAWRLFTTLTTITLLPKYCKTNYFADTKLKPSDSWCGKSILVGKDVCKKGIDAQIWNEEQAFISQNFIKNTISEPGKESHKLNHIINPFSHTWQTSNATSILSHDEACLIHLRTFFIFGGQDRLVWKFNSSGDFSIASAYRMLFN